MKIANLKQISISLVEWMNLKSTKINWKNAKMKQIYLPSRKL